MESASNEPPLPFQRYCGILLGVNLDIQSVLLNLYEEEWIEDFAGCVTLEG